ncbi:MAG TPA: AAA-like domain-containing protein, partial [Chthonomonadaceae bacterium]|nr:AAA-like domain-containing protein [Chthonomonadaceae bacterium]
VPPLIWSLDEVDRLFTYPFGSDVFSLFRSWHNRRALDPTGPWRSLTLAMTYATEAHLFISDLNQSPFNIGTRLTLHDFSLTQVAELNRRYGTPLQTESEVARLYELLSGHPYLTQKSLVEMATRGLDIHRLEAQSDRNDGLFGDHLRRLLASLTQDARLTAVVRARLQGEQDLAEADFYRLRSAGVLTGDTAFEAYWRCPVYRTYLQRHLL